VEQHHSRVRCGSKESRRYREVRGKASGLRAAVLPVLARALTIAVLQP
jgi:hypothetical protein